MMNKERLLALADVVEKSESLNMVFAFWGLFDGDETEEHPCGTAACILGHAEVMRLGRPARDSDYLSTFPWKEAAAFLGLDHVQAEELFMPYSSKYRDEEDMEERIDQVVDYAKDTISGEHAARVLRELAANADPKPLPIW